MDHHCAYATDAWTTALFSTRLYLVDIACLVDRIHGKSAASRPQTFTSYACTQDNLGSFLVSGTAGDLRR